MTAHQKYLRNASFIALSISGCAAYILIPIYGLNGAAFSILMNSIVLNGVCVFKIRKSFNFWSIYVPVLKLDKKGRLIKDDKFRQEAGKISG
jgi:O-antigen/teichoic acid export membrane protein